MNESSSIVASDAGHVFSGIQAFDAAQRMAKALSSSALVPKIYQGQQGLANSLIALELANRMGISPLTVMQNMKPINGIPSWSSSFLIGTVNACGRFTPLRFIFDDVDEPTSCYAEANDLATGEVLRGEKITIAMAKAEGWYGRSGSKWPTMPGQMLRYRAGAFWARAYCPEISLGIVTKEEAVDVETVEVSVAEPATPAASLPEAVGFAPEPEAVEAQEVAAGHSEVFVGIMASIAAAADNAPWEKSLTRAKQLLSEGKINEREHAEIDAAIQRRIQQAQRQQPAAAEQQAEPATEPTPSTASEAEASAPAQDSGGAAAADPDPDSHPLPPAGDSPLEPDAPVSLKLRDRQQLIRTVNACAPERKAPLLAALGKHFTFDPDAPIASQLSTQAHADFVTAYLQGA